MSDTYEVAAGELTAGEAVDLAADLLDWARAHGGGDPAETRLAFPVDIHRDGRAAEIEVVTMRRPTVKDLRKIAPIVDDELRALALTERLSGLARPAFDKLDAVDVERLAEVVAGFRRRSRRDGPPAE